MGAMYDVKMSIEQAINAKKLDLAQTNGSIALKAGVLLALVSPSTPDDPVKLQKLRTAAKEVLGVNL
jgi:hypothetical protein